MKRANRPPALEADDATAFHFPRSEDPRRADGSERRRRAPPETAAAAARARRSARGLGWLSLGLGLVETLLPATVARATGLEGRERLIRAYGAREIACGIGLLTARDPLPWVWGRVGGDALDVSALAQRWLDDGDRRPLVALAALAPVVAADLACAAALSPRVRGDATCRAYRAERSGFAGSADPWGAARADFVVPDDFAVPQALRPWDDRTALATAQPPGSLDEGLAETFPASDPVAVSITRAVAGDPGDPSGSLALTGLNIGDDSAYGKRDFKSMW